MVRVRHFLRKPDVRMYRLQGERITLHLTDQIFPPSPHGKFFANNIIVHKGESVIDIGTGSGILAVLAAKLGGRVCATDSDSDAIRASEKNAVVNKVKILFSVGNYFSRFKGKFDVIIANLPQEIVHPAYQRAIGPKLSRTISGGAHGNAQLLHFLRIARRHMRRSSRLYIIVNTVTDYAETLREIVSRYRVRLVNFGVEPTKEFIAAYPRWYRALYERGVIHIYRRNQHWYAHEYLFELQLP